MDCADHDCADRYDELGAPSWGGWGEANSPREEGLAKSARLLLRNRRFVGVLLSQVDSLPSIERAIIHFDQNSPPAHSHGILTLLACTHVCIALGRARGWFLGARHGCERTRHSGTWCLIATRIDLTCRCPLLRVLNGCSPTHNLYAERAQSCKNVLLVVAGRALSGHQQWWGGRHLGGTQLGRTSNIVARGGWAYHGSQRSDRGAPCHARVLYRSHPQFGSSGALGGQLGYCLQ